MTGHDGGGVTTVNGVVTMVNGGVVMCGYLEVMEVHSMNLNTKLKSLTRY